MTDRLTAGLLPCVGTVYESWAEEPSAADTDIQLMKSLGISLAVIGGDLGDRITGAEGNFDFSLLSYAVRKLDRDGIRVIVRIPLIPGKTAEEYTALLPRLAESCAAALSRFGAVAGWSLPLAEGTLPTGGCYLKAAEAIAVYSAAPVCVSCEAGSGCFYSGELSGGIAVGEGNNSLRELLYFCDMLRTLRPFCFTASVAGGSRGFVPEGKICAEALIPLFSGASAAVNRQWKETSTSAVPSGALVSAANRPSVYSGELKNAAATAEKCRDFLSHTTVLTETAVFQADASVKAVLPFAEAIRACGFCPDILTGSLSLDRYSVIFTPFRQMFTVGELAGLSSWTERGGVWVAGPDSDLMLPDGKRPVKSPYTRLERLTRAFVCSELYDPEGLITTATADGESFSQGGCMRLFDAAEGDFAKVTGGGVRVQGKSVARAVPYGKGFIVLLGVMPSPQGLNYTVRLAAEKARLTSFCISGQVACFPRSGARDDGKPLDGIAVVEYGGREGGFYCPRPALELISGRMMTGKITVPPYGALLLMYT